MRSVCYGCHYSEFLLNKAGHPMKDRAGRCKFPIEKVTVPACIQIPIRKYITPFDDLEVCMCFKKRKEKADA